MKPIIEFQHISKKFRIGAQQQPYLSLRGSLLNVFRRKNSKTHEFYALDDIDFSVEQGETLGIIGRNGAGKSTLLKVLSKITPPTSGQIVTRGRIASLLEVGTGFHPELTGRDNVYMNGSILGMRRHEIKKNFEAIVDFAGVEKFIDTPLKHYSSGMQLRLAFAVAAFLENEILVIDEVLAVGDAEFQKKCLGKMDDVSKSGRTILFVSHNLESLIVLCKKGVLIEKGMIRTIGSMNEVINEYNSNFQSSYSDWLLDDRPGDNFVKLNSVKLVDEKKNQLFQPSIDSTFGVCIEFEVLVDGIKPSPNLHFFNAQGIYCFVAITEVDKLNKGIYKSYTWIPANFLNNQIYRVGIAITSLKDVYVHLYEKEVISFEVIEDKIERLSEFGGTIPGVIRPYLINEIESYEY
jgi:lipopolysaccharide transport system ATP-binding protein